MGPEQFIDLFRSTLTTVILLVSVIIVPGLVVGLIISVFQAATQINEQTLSFIPRLLVTLGALMFFGPWLLNQVLDFTRTLISEIGQYVV